MLWGETMDNLSLTELNRMLPNSRVRWNLVLWSKMELRNCRQFVGRHPSEMELDVIGSHPSVTQGWSCMLRNCRQFVGRHPSEMEELERLSRWLDWPTIASPRLESHTNIDKYTNTQIHKYVHKYTLAHNCITATRIPHKYRWIHKYTQIHTCPQLHHHH